jgi:hypothetical protein
MQHELADVDRQWRAGQDREPTGPELARLLYARYVVPKKRWWQR